MGAKFSQISVRVDRRMLDRIEVLLARGEYASKSDFAYQALNKALDQDEYERQIRQQVIELLTSDKDVAEAFAARIREVLASSLNASARGNITKTVQDRRV